MSAVTAMPVARYSPRAPAVLPTAVSATSRCTATLTWQSGRANRSTSSRPIRINSLSDALAVRSKKVGIGGRDWGLAFGNASSTASPSSADARARATSSFGSGFAAVVPATPMRPCAGPIRTKPRSAPPAATARRRHRPCRERRRAGDRSYVPADQCFLDAHVRRPFSNRQRELAALAAAAAHLIPGEVAGDVIDAIERLEQIARQHDVLHELGDLAVANHVAPARRERKVLEHRLAAERAAGVDAELDVGDEVVESDTLLAGGDVGVGHAHDRRVTE